MNYVLDIHTHTIMSGHAYSTINEMAKSASKKGIDLLGITDHAPKMPGSCGELYFSNFKVIPKMKYGVELLMGVELNILDENGTVDLSQKYLKKMDIVIASLHTPCIAPATIEENTASYLNVMKNPYVDVIGHPDDGKYPVDYKQLVEGALKYGKLLELNNNSMSPDSFRIDSYENYAVMLEYCRKFNVKIIISSDAHIDDDVGRHDYAEVLLKDVSFPEELIVNKSVDEFKNFINNKNK